MKILVTGSNGQLGNEISKLSQGYPETAFLFTDLAELDISDEEAVGQYFFTEKPDVVINCAAYTAVDKAEQEETLAYLVNSKAVGNLARAAAQYNAFLVHISTDYVFEGNFHRPYVETDVTNPVSKYAKSKFSGEKMIQAHATRAMIIRTSWLYSEYGHNFVKTILRYGKERGKLSVVFDQIGSPTYALDLARLVLAVVHRPDLPESVEIFHYSNEGVASWYDFACAIIELSGISCKILPIETREYPLPAARPFYSVFNKSKIKQRFQIEIPHWRESLKVCLKNITISNQ
jgi:dTDP-4-dehydrorhamnose reductase